MVVLVFAVYIGLNRFRKLNHGRFEEGAFYKASL
jgi:hypothetical protein